jgi:hypothetical protein
VTLPAVLTGVPDAALAFGRFPAPNSSWTLILSFIDVSRDRSLEAGADT